MIHIEVQIEVQIVKQDSDNHTDGGSYLDSDLVSDRDGDADGDWEMNKTYIYCICIYDVDKNRLMFIHLYYSKWWFWIHDLTGWDGDGAGHTWFTTNKNTEPHSGSWLRS